MLQIDPFLEGQSPELTLVNESFDQGKWFTYREEFFGIYFRFNNCSTISSYTRPDLVMEYPEVYPDRIVLAFARDSSPSEFVQIVWELASQQTNSDHYALVTDPFASYGDPLKPIAAGAGPTDDGVRIRICSLRSEVFRSSEPPGRWDRSLLFSHEYTIHSDSRTVTYEETEITSLYPGCL